MDIKLKIKLSAYSKGILRTKTSELENDANFISDAPIDNKIYGRKNGGWSDINQELDRPFLTTLENSGLNIIQDGVNYQLGIRKFEGNKLPSNLEEDTTYYIADLTANNYVNGGTSFSEGNNDYIIQNEFKNTLNGGKANSSHLVSVLPLNAEGVYNG